MNSKNIIFLLAISILSLIGCSQKNTEARYSITGTIQNAANQKMILQEYNQDGAPNITIDTITLGEKGQFNFSFLAHEEGLYRLAIENELDNGFEILILNDAKNIQVNADANNFESYVIKGSIGSEVLNQFLKNYRKKEETFHIVSNSLNTLQDMNGDPNLIAQKQKEQILIINDLNQFVTKSILESTSPVIIRFLLEKAKRSMETSQVLAYAKAAAEKTKSELLAKFVTSLTNQIQANATSTPISVGRAAPEIAMADPNGKIITLSSLKGKYVLVDFWASWCGPCRAENPNVVSAFEKFKNKKFTVLGVSLDDDKAAWQEAIRADKLNWQHISDLKKWESTVVNTYQFQGIPFNVLLDTNGMIIAKELRGQALQDTLASILK